MTIKAFEVAIDEEESVDEAHLSFKGDPHTYICRPPKATAVARLHVLGSGSKEGLEKMHVDLEALYDFFGGKTDKDGNRPGGVMSAEDFERIQGRMDDPNDRLDVAHLAEAFKWVLSGFTGNPTSSSSD